MPEVMGDAGLTADPFSEEDIAAKMTKLVQDKQLYQKLKDSCANNVARFSWDKTTELYWKSIQKI
jgi:glycosyltransferase involved in cell wall biosynthesis